MKFGLRKFSLNKRIAARTSWKRYIRHSMGLKAPRGFSFITNPKRAIYNRIYNRTSINIDRSASKTRAMKNGDKIGINVFLILLFGFIIMIILASA